MSRRRLLVIGLDGASWDILDPLIEEGVLCNLKELRQKGISKVLRSNFPPVTASAWMSIATGKTPGETGVFDFWVLNDRGDWRLRPVTSSDYQAHGAVWDHLAASGRKVAVVNYPMLYPVYPIKGIMISGLGAPAGGNIFYPADLKDDLAKSIGRHKIYTPFARPRYANPKAFIRDIRALISYSGQLSSRLIDRSYDLFVFIISASDFLSHYAWGWWENKDSAYHRVFRDIWAELDAEIGKMLKVWSGGDVLVISDHGMGPLREIFLINQWLKEKGYLHLKGDTSSVSFPSLKRSLKSGARKTYDLAARIFPRLTDNVFGLARGAKKYYDIGSEIDFERTKAFALKHSGLGNIYVNSTEQDNYGSILREIIAELKTFCYQRQKTIEIFSKHELYPGNFAKRLPDIVFMIDGNAVEVVPSVHEGKDFFSRPLVSNKTGSHRLEGVFLFSGSGLKKEDISSEPCELKDIYPFIFNILGETIPSYPIAAETADQSPQEGSGKDSAFNNEQIMRNLKDLGYV
jgi:predicted AlkP superfamily phosphohydrolase/phosphomutase